jgi:uncharacterized membrane protein YgcG
MQVTTFGRIIMLWQRRVLTLAFAGVLVLALTPHLPIAGQQLPQETTQGQTIQENSAELQQLVAPIALYPDALVAQILAASTYPTQVVQADRWLQQHSNLQGEELAAAVDKQSWDPGVKALTAFPTVLANLDKNLSWTEALGDAYFNQQQDVLSAVQVMRRRAEDAGNLRSTQQETVVTQGPTIVIEPVEPGVCYLPIYDPWIVYGAPVDIYPGYFYNAWVGPPIISFGPAIGLGFFGGFGWGWPAWGFNWRNRVVVFNHATYVTRSRTFFHRYPMAGERGRVRLDQREAPSGGARVSGAADRSRSSARPDRSFDRSRSARVPTLNSGQNFRITRGFAQPRPGIRSGNIYRNGAAGVVRGNAPRSASSFGAGHLSGGGGGVRSGGGGSRSGGGGGRHR